MNFNDHSQLAGKHAILSPSYAHWLNYDDQKLIARITALNAATRGTDLHALAHEAIRLGVRLDPTDNYAIAAYVDDALEMGLKCEVPLYYSSNCFGHADTLGFFDGVLRVHDLKNGVTPVKFTQLEIYNALFCLEYDIEPYSIEFVNRIYQGDEIREDVPTNDRVAYIMDRIVELDERIELLRKDSIR